MLWLLLGACGYLFSVGYTAWSEGADDSTIHELDPIDPGIAGCIDIESLLQYGCKKRWNPAIRTLSLLQHPTRFIITPIPTQRAIWSQKKYMSHFETLAAARIIEAQHGCECTSYSTYFSVRKNDTFDRAIFNGRRVSKMFARPPPVNLITTSLLIKKLDEVLKNFPEAHITVGDFRHQFHQLPCGELSKFFGVACGRTRYKWKTVPMGFSHSPAIAQTVSLLLLTHGLIESGLVDSEFLKDQELPQFIPIRGGGFLIVYYDNYLIVTTSGTAMAEFNDQFRKTCSEFNAVVKEHQTFYPNTQSTTCPEDFYQADWRKTENMHLARTDPGELHVGFKYLGLHIRCQDQQMTWRVDQSKIDLLSDTLPSTHTPRACALITGKVLASFGPSGRPFGSDTNMVDIIDVLRTVARFAHVRNSWDARICLTEAQLSALETGWTNLIRNPWREVRSVCLAESFIVATDASNWGWGVVVLDENGNIVKQHKKPWSTEEAKAHIFIREIWAAERGLKYFESLPMFKKDVHIYLVIDNTATAWAFQRGYTVNRIAMRAIRNVLHLYDNWSIVTVVSEDNVADKPSRNKVATTLFAIKTFEAVQRSKMGRKCGIIKRQCDAVDGQKMRHVEYDDDDDHEHMLLDLPGKEKREDVEVENGNESDEENLVSDILV